MAIVARGVTAGLAGAMAGIHLHLWSTGYRHIHIIGTLFLLNGVGGSLLALALLATSSRLLGALAAQGTLFTTGTLLALILSLTAGLFGFKEYTGAPFPNRHLRRRVSRHSHHRAPRRRLRENHTRLVAHPSEEGDLARRRMTGALPAHADLFAADSNLLTAVVRINSGNDIRAIKEETKRMTDTRPTRRRSSARILAGGALAAVATLTVTACGSSPSPSSTKTPTSPSAAPAQSSGSTAAYTVATATVVKVGTVLVNGKGRTLYLLDSEKGGKLTCSDANGCTKVWPDTELPDGVTKAVSGSGINSTLLSTVKSPEGKLYLTYGPSKWPLYTYSGDSAPRQANGQGIHSFGGTWSAITPAGDAAVAGSPSGRSGSTGGGY